MNEEAVTEAFKLYLSDRGWDVLTDLGDYTDVMAKRGAELLVAEVKGLTKSPEVAVDIGYGQVLRALSRHPEATQGALVAPEHLRAKVLRVSPGVRRKLDLDVFLVDDFGVVTLVTD